jgi:hypothetical protein
MPITFSNEDLEWMAIEELRTMEPYLLDIVTEVKRRGYGIDFIKENVKHQYILLFMLNAYTQIE